MACRSFFPPLWKLWSSHHVASIYCQNTKRFRNSLGKRAQETVIETCKYQVKLGASSDISDIRQIFCSSPSAFCNSQLILRSVDAECLTTSSTVTGRLYFHVSVIDNRLHWARAVPVCPGNVFVFIFCLKRGIPFHLSLSLSLSPSLLPKTHIFRWTILRVFGCVSEHLCVTHAVKWLPGEA